MTDTIRKSKKAYAAGVGEIQARLEIVETWETEEILQELGRLVPAYTIETVAVFNGRFGNDRGPERPYAFGISFEIPGEAFAFKASAHPMSNTLREAALRALQGALAMSPHGGTDLLGGQL